MKSRLFFIFLLPLICAYTPVKQVADEGVLSYTIPSEIPEKKLDRGKYDPGNYKLPLWYVITDNFYDLDKALSEAERINNGEYEFSAVVFHSNNRIYNYQVVIGQQLPLNEAYVLERTARRDGFEYSVTWCVLDKK